MLLAKVRIMAKVTLPTPLADQYGIRPGDEIQWESAGEVIRVIPRSSIAGQVGTSDLAMRLSLFDQASARHQNHQKGAEQTTSEARGWTREQLYDNDGAN